MPLHCQSKTIRPRIFKSLNQAIRGPGSRNKVIAHGFDALMMVAVDCSRLGAGELCQKTAFEESGPVRGPVARRTLLMLDRFGQLRRNVLEQCATAKDIEYLHTKT